MNSSSKFGEILVVGLSVHITSLRIDSVAFIKDFGVFVTLTFTFDPSV